MGHYPAGGGFGRDGNSERQCAYDSAIQIEEQIARQRGHNYCHQSGYCPVCNPASHVGADEDALVESSIADRSRPGNEDDKGLMRQFGNIFR